MRWKEAGWRPNCSSFQPKNAPQHPQHVCSSVQCFCDLFQKFSETRSFVQKVSPFHQRATLESCQKVLLDTFSHTVTEFPSTCAICLVLCSEDTRRCLVFLHCRSPVRRLEETGRDLSKFFSSTKIASSFSISLHRGLFPYFSISQLSVPVAQNYIHLARVVLTCYRL